MTPTVRACKRRSLIVISRNVVTERAYSGGLRRFRVEYIVKFYGILR